MNLKKTLSFVIAATLSCSVLFTSVASAEDVSAERFNLMMAAGEIKPDIGAENSEKTAKISKDQAIAAAKKVLENRSDYEVAYVTLNRNYRGMDSKTWNIELRRVKAPGGNASVAVDSDTGEIVSFDIWEGNDGQINYVAKITKAEARVKAEEYIKNQLKEDINGYELQKENPYAYSYRMGGVKENVIYNFVFAKKVNNIPFTNYTINIGISGVDGQVMNYYSNRARADEKKFPSAAGVISVEKALENYKAMISVVPQYVSINNEVPYGMSTSKVMLAYVPATYVSMLDAKTGKVTNYDGSSIDMTSDEVKNVLNNPVPMKPDAKLTDKAISEKDAKAKAEEYKKTIEKLLGISFDNQNEAGYNPYYYQSSNQEEVWNFNWNKDSEKNHIYLNISISAKTGHLLNFSVGNYDTSYDMAVKEGKKPEAVVEKVNWNKGKQTAVEILKSIAPEQYGFYVDENVNEPQLTDDLKKFMKEYGYSFTRIVNGLRFRDNSASVSIDRQTGVLKNLYFNWSDVEFPDKVLALTGEEAASKYFEGTEAKLIYFIGTTYGPDGEVKDAEVPKLAYTFTTKNQGVYGTLMIDAKTGKQVDMYGNEIKPETPAGEPNIAEHWAKRSAELLIAQGMLKNPNVDLESKLTRAEAVKLMTLARGMYYYNDGISTIEPSFRDVPKDNEYFLYVENAVKQKIISKESAEFKGSEKLTKAEFVKLLVNLVGYWDIAKYSDIFKVSNMANVPSEMTGHAAIANALGILPVKSGAAFDGNDEVTYGEAAYALYKALSFIK